ncbi:MAG TPA: hypothetical protein VEJ84_19525 [Acidimicrobiales bacterium]|nr:hypothetical protein [Acidimicrobiales bacterium]
MRRQTVGLTLVAAAALSVPFAVSQVTSAGAAGVRPDQAQAGTVTIQSWVYAVPSEDVLSGTLWACTKITGAINEESGGPTWDSDSAYSAPEQLQGTAAVTAASRECADKVPVGGFVHVPAPEPGQYPFAQYTATPGAASGQSTGLSTLYSDQTISGQKGDIFITIASAYNFTAKPIQVGSVTVQPWATGPDATWVITGGTGDYAGLEGSGTWYGNAATFPWIYRPGTGKVWWAGTASNS